MEHASAPPADPGRVGVDEIVARYYDWEHDALTADVALYVELARQARGPVLELGCGTGRVLAALGRAGLQAVGVELSPEMLARAHARLADRAVPAQQCRLVQADARTLDLPERFALVAAPLDFLGYFVSRADARAVLAAARRHLQPNGQLVIDVPFPPAAFLDQPQGVLVHQWTRADVGGDLVTKSWVREIDVVAQVQRLTAFYDLAAPDGPLRRWVHLLTLRYYYPLELELLVESGGFRVEGIYGDYALEGLEADSPRLIVTARPLQ